ncbi:helix-turn-helix domain-containing protein [Streptomyces sp. NPDC057798]|uniref:helix-turn-helix domain-containing protein n=1 Tax=Streptomyces sp. NPDC057798 TaxID=3346252 RepID=UPI00369A4C6C
MLQSHAPRSDDFGLACWQGRVSVMDHAHRHDDIEINFAGDTDLVYLFRGRRTVLRRGGIAAFWAAVPHQLVSATPNSTMRWLTVPSEIFLGWRMPDPVIRNLLRGVPLLESVPGPQDADHALFSRWSEDLTHRDEEPRRIALLEIEARLRRLALATAAEHHGVTALPRDGAVEHAARMAHFITVHFREPLTVDRVAAAVPLHPHYAMRVFKEVIGTTLHAYLAECRMAEARRLLAATDVPLTEVALTAGFGSQSSFYSRFTAANALTPGKYRRLHRA